MSFLMFSAAFVGFVLLNNSKDNQTIEYFIRRKQGL